VLGRQRQSEGIVEAGTPLLEVGDPRALEVAVDVLSADAVRIRPGTPVVLERWGGEQPLEGVTRSVEPVGFTKLSALGVEEQRVWVIADLRSPAEAWSRLGEGYRVEASFIVWQGEQVLQIPASALFRQGEGWAVFVIENGQARRRVVEIGQRGGLTVEIRSGLTEGERVVTHPDDTLHEDAAVRIRAER
jgi:HlyD family secretion protein